MKTAKTKIVNNTFAEIKQVIVAHDDLLVVSHVQPDGDNVGSVLALTRSLAQIGKRVTGVINGAVPERYEFLTGASELLSPEDALYVRRGLVIALDCADKDRLGVALQPLLYGVPVINIDHHVNNDRFGDYIYVDGESAATAAILTEFMLAVDLPMDCEIATSLYVGILTDCGCFTFPNTSGRTLRAAAELFRFPLDLETIRANAFGNVSLARKRLLGKVLSAVEVLAGGRIAISVIHADQMQALGVKGTDFEGIIDHLAEIRHVCFAFLLRESQPGITKVSIRTHGAADATVIASAFGGGGHKAAAGCTIHMPPNDAKAQILHFTMNYLEANQ